MRILFSTILFLISVLVRPFPANAAGEFETAYDVSYAISPAGVTTATQKIRLTNKTTNLYPQQYAVTLDSTNIRNVIAYDAGGVMTPKITQPNGKTEILLTFHTPVVGLGKTQEFTLRYEQADIAQKNGMIWEVNIPGVLDDGSLTAYDVSVQVPPSFGPNAYLTPLAANGRKWTKEQMVAGGISGAWGLSQQFDLTLLYHLGNTTLSPSVQEITIPPDTAFQTVAIRSLNPEPEGLSRDADGNWIASYQLAPGESLDIEALLTVRTFLTPQQEFPMQPVDEPLYLTPTKYWQTDDAKIREIASQLATPRAVYEYVVGALSYNYERVNQNPVRKGAAAALADPESAICMEFTDLFVALARAAGIPAREVVGYAYTSNAKLRPLSLVTDVLHAWPEYYDRERRLWIPVDPTWADTTGGVNYFDKLDFNHIAFAIHGLSSERPYPAGFFRKADSSGKDVQVAFAASPSPEIPASSYDVEFRLPAQVTAGWQTRGEVVVKNTGGKAVSDVAISLEIAPYGIFQTLENQYFPPLGTQTIPITLPAGPVFAKGVADIRVTVDGTTFTHQMQIRPLWWLLIPVQLGLIAFILILWIRLRKK